MKIVFIGPLRSSFVKNDIDILASEHTLFLYDSEIGKGVQGAINLCSVTFKILWQLIFADAVFSWFADYTSFLPTIWARLLQKKAFVVAGGFDVGYLPEINYGARCRKVRWFCVKNTFRFATKIFPVSQYALRQLRMLTKGNHAPAPVIYNGVDLGKFPAPANTLRERLVITVSQGDSVAEYIRKGSNRFIKIAKLLPDIQFKLIGISGAALKQARHEAIGITNLEIIPGFISLTEILPFYQKAAIYCQLSIEETFGVAVIEAMASGCAPLVTSGGALTEIVPDKKFIVDNDSDIVANIRHFLNDPDYIQYRRQAEKFSLDRRRRALLSEVKKI